MCGIAGFSGPRNPEGLRRMTRALLHRGPDEEGYFESGMNLGLRRLAIVDPQEAHQPCVNENGEIALVFNGEIYNFKELRESLALLGVKFRTRGDTEVLLRLYEQSGLEFLNQINGMFAIAVWDGRTQELFLIRDRLGVKPLYYAECAGEIYFASEIKALLEIPALRRGFDLTALSHYFTFKHIPAPLSAFAGIKQVEPGQYLRFANGKSQLVSYWTLKYDAACDIREKEAADGVLNILTDAVKIRMRSDVPLGMLLSGGVDSAAVLQLMLRSGQRPGSIKTFTLGYEDGPETKEEDARHARKLARTLGTEHHEHRISSLDFIAALPAIVRAFDEPFSGVTSTYFITALVRKHVKTVMSGDGSDELFGSYLPARLAQPLAYYSQHRNELISAKAGMSGEAREALKPFESRKEYLENIWAAQSDADPFRWRYSLYVFEDEEKVRLFSPEFLSAVTNSSLSLFEEQARRLRSKDVLNQVLEFDMNTLLPDEVLVFSDRLSMANSVEIRSPFLDYRLAEFAAHIPGQFKIRGGIVKSILKKALASIVPPEILERPKEGFVPPVYFWMNNKLRPFITDVLAPGRLKIHGLLSAQHVDRLLNQHFRLEQDHSAKIWNLLMFQLWAETYFESGG